jgi:hypothetical protein
MRELDLILKTKVFVHVINVIKLQRYFLLRIKIMIDLPG